MERKIFHLFSALVMGNIERTASALLEINISKKDPDSDCLKEGLHNVLGDYYDQPIGKIDFQSVFYGSIEVARKSHIKIPAQLVLFGKSLVTMEGFCKQVDPTFNIITDAKVYVNKFIKKKLSPVNIAKQSKDLAFQMYELVILFPEMVRSISRKFQLVEQRIIDSDKTFKKLTNVIWSAGKLLSLTLIFATIMIAAVMLIHVPPTYKGYSIFSLSALFVNFFIFIGILRLILTDKFSFN
jgi:ubiquinone biosynthesis protein